MTQLPRVVVLGGQGLLGSSLVPHLRSAQYETLILARQGDADAVLDPTNSAQLGMALDGLRPDVIFNLAALTNVDECERNPQVAYRSNVLIVENLAKWTKANACSCHLVQLSTDQVYDGIGPHQEDDLAPSNYYGFSKLAGELTLANVSSTILRTNFFGLSRSPKRKSLSDWLVESLQQDKEITVFEDVFFSPLTLQRLTELLELVMARRVQGVFNLGSRDGMSKADFAFMLADVVGLSTSSMRRGSSDDLKLSAYRPKDMRMDSTRFEIAFGVELPTLKEEIESMRSLYACQP